MLAWWHFRTVYFRHFGRLFKIYFFYFHYRIIVQFILKGDPKDHLLLTPITWLWIWPNVTSEFRLNYFDLLNLQGFFFYVNFFYLVGFSFMFFVVYFFVLFLRSNQHGAYSWKKYIFLKWIKINTNMAAWKSFNTLYPLEIKTQVICFSDSKESLNCLCWSRPGPWNPTWPPSNITKPFVPHLYFS